MSRGKAAILAAGQRNLRNHLRFLARKDSKGRQYAQLLIEAMVKRAISRSDTLRERNIRSSGRAHHTSRGNFGLRGNTIIIDIPRPPRLPINASGNGHKPPEGNDQLAQTVSHHQTTTATTEGVYFPYLIPAEQEGIYSSSETVERN